MIRTILKSTKSSITIELPDDLVGKTIEVIAFEIDQATPSKKTEAIELSKITAAIDKALSKHRADLPGLRDEADE